MKDVVIYTDGACTGNPGPGGYGVILLYGNVRKELSAGFRLTTNNRMEMWGCIAGMVALKEACNVTLYSDSRYVVDAMTKAWVDRWSKNNWQRQSDGKWQRVLNVDLWIQIADLCQKHRVRFEWVRGHDGNEGNERCDELARSAILGTLGIDSEYEANRRAGGRTVNE
jgi:ribonuclease HI